MNGFMLLVLVVLAGQVSPGGLAMPPSANPVQPASMLTTPPPQTDYGWIIDKDNALVFIVQISPDKEAIMKKANQVLESEIPPVVAARIKRVIVRFGNDVIEPTPLEEVEKLPLVYGNTLAADLPTGQMRTLENNNGYALQNVAGGSQPPPLSPGGLGMSLADAASSLSDKVNEAIQDPSSLLAQNRTNPAASPGAGFMQDAMGNRGATSATPPYPPTTPTNSFGMPGSGMPTSTATTPPPTAPSFPNTGAQASNVPSLGLPQNNNAGSLGVPGLGTAGVNTSGVGAGNGYDPRYNSSTNNNLGVNYNQAPHSTVPGGSFTSLPSQSGAVQGTGRPGFANAPLGSAPLSTGTPWSATTASTPYAPNTQGYSTTPGYTGSPYVQSPSSYTGYPNQNGVSLPTDPLSMRVADTRGSVPSTSNPNAQSSTGRSSSWATRNDGYSNDGYNDTQTQLAQRTGMENIMPVMFVLSLVVNFYLGMLIRKLLGRYRTLLASVRSQTV